MNMLSRIARNQRIALNIIGKKTYNQQAVYDITEFLYIENKKYVLTYDTGEFKKQCHTEDILLNIMDIAYYDKLKELDQYANDTNRKLWNMLIFPTPRDRQQRIHTCNGIFIVEYYLSDKYDDKKRFVQFLTK